jgi:hypothetical protein
MGVIQNSMICGYNPLGRGTNSKMPEALFSSVEKCN